MLSNYVAAVKAKSIMFGANYKVWDHPNIKYFINSTKINRPLTIMRKNIIDISILLQNW